jgi:hypothetical protein
MSQERISAAQYREMFEQEKTHKYGAKRTTVDGIKFDSKREADYYCELKLLKRSGEIQDFEIQPEFVLIEDFTKFGEKVKGIKYRADFKITHNDGSVEIIDVKGSKKTLTDVYKIKKKLFEARYKDLRIKEVY